MCIRDSSNADFTANELVQVLQPYKIIFLSGTGGLLDAEGRVIDSINLSTEYDELMAQPWINGGMRVKICLLYTSRCV